MSEIVFFRSISEPMPQENFSATSSDDRSAPESPRLEDFEYDLPAELIAQEPTTVRHGSRLMVVNRTSGTISHRKFQEISTLVRGGDVLVVNNTRVLPARLIARRSTGGLVQLLLLRPEASQANLWHAMASPLRKLKEGDQLLVDSSAGQERSVRVEEIFEASDRQRRLIVDLGPPETVHSLLSEIGYAPLPPYIQRDGDRRQRLPDLDRYQTVYAQAPGAVAAPTAGLHFSDQILNDLKDHGVEICTVTLHVGPGTFKPISSSLEQHMIEEETFSIPADTACLVNRALAEKRRVIAVGTTSCRALETAGAAGSLEPVDESKTSLYIRPGHSFRIVTGLLTNFHLSRSSLLVLVSAFAGHDLIMRAYRRAIEERYRFYSYGDAMLIF